LKPVLQVAHEKHHLFVAAFQNRLLCAPPVLGDILGANENKRIGCHPAPQFFRHQKLSPSASAQASPRLGDWPLDHASGLGLRLYGLARSLAYLVWLAPSGLDSGHDFTFFLTPFNSPKAN
jgi:hypothetical protein